MAKCQPQLKNVDSSSLIICTLFNLDKDGLLDEIILGTFILEDRISYYYLNLSLFMKL